MSGSAVDHRGLAALDIRSEQDVVLARRRARQVAEILGLDVQDQSRLATAVSEVARNAFEYAGSGTVEFLLDGSSTPDMVLVRVRDHGPGISDLDAVLGGSFESPAGAGLGIVGARRLTDHFEISSSPAEGTTVLLGKRLPRGASAALLARAGLRLDGMRSLNLAQDVREQNQELLRTLSELRQRQLEIERLNKELEETNRGVVALYMELDERAEDLGRAADLKSRVLSDMSH